MQTMQTFQRPKVTATVLSASVLALFLVGLSPLPQLLAAPATGGNLAPAATLNPVQVSIQTKNLTAIGSYDLVAYNSTGALVASYTGQYPKVTLQLPSGTYLFAANVNGPSQTYPPCYLKGASAPGVASPPVPAPNQGAGASSAIAYPCYYSNPPREYGYSLTQVSGSTTVNIATQPPASIPTAPVSVSVSFKNGTAVNAAYVYANVVGANWYWGDNTRLTLYAQTGTNGVAHLVVPAVPLAVTASKSVQVSLPKGQTTVQVNIGGQVVNVTLYYSPSYVYETASGLLIPPQTSLSLVVTAQTGYPVIPYASGVAQGQVSGGAGVGGLPPNLSQPGQISQGAPAEAQSGVNSTTTAQLTSIPPLPASGLVASTPASSGAPAVNLLAIGTLALAGAIAATVGVVLAKTRH